MEEGLLVGTEPLVRDRPGHSGRNTRRSIDIASDILRPADRLPVWAVSSLIVPQGSPLGMWRDTPLSRSAPNDGATTEIAPLGLIHRIVAAIQQSRRSARSEYDLHGLSDHMLKDIGLRREDVGYGFIKPSWHLD